MKYEIFDKIYKQITNLGYLITKKGSRKLTNWSKIVFVFCMYQEEKRLLTHRSPFSPHTS